MLPGEPNFKDINELETIEDLQAYFSNPVILRYFDGYTDVENIIKVLAGLQVLIGSPLDGIDIVLFHIITVSFADLAIEDNKTSRKIFNGLVECGFLHLRTMDGVIAVKPGTLQDYGSYRAVITDTTKKIITQIEVA